MQELSPLALEALQHKVPAPLLAAHKIHNCFLQLELGNPAPLTTVQAWDDALHTMEKWATTQRHLKADERHVFSHALSNLRQRLLNDKQDNPAASWLKALGRDAALEHDVATLQEICEAISVAKGRDSSLRAVA
jgi:hypothetical protein